MPPPGKRKKSVVSKKPTKPTSKKGKGPGRGQQRSQSKRDYQRRQKEKEQRANVREAARRPVITKTSQRQPGLAGSTSAKTMAPALKANRLEKEFKTASDDRKKQIVKELKNTRSELNRLNKEQSVLDLRKATAGLGNQGLVARTTDGTIITDSSGNPIMTTRGREVFDKTRGKFSKEAGRLLEESPELYKRMYPISYGLQKGLPKLMEFAPVIGPIGRIAKATLGKAQDVGSGIMGSKIGQSIASAPRGFFGDLKNMAGDIFGGLGSFVPGGRTGDSIQAERPSGGGGGMEDAAQSVINQQHPWGAWIGMDPNAPRTGDFRDSDGDGIDDRYQTGPGAPYQGPAIDPSQLKNPTPWDSSFQVGPIMMPPRYIPPAMTTDIAASQAAGYDIPLGGQPANMEDWYKNLGIMNLANRRIG